VICRNLAFSLVYNAVAASLAIAGFVRPLLAAILMPCSSLVVVLSAALTPTFKETASARIPALRPSLVVSEDRLAGQGREA
jgi:hypothetical protein